MKDLEKYTKEELRDALVKKHKYDNEKIKKKEIEDANHIFNFIKEKDFFAIKSNNSSFLRLYAIDKEQIPKIFKWKIGVISVKLDRMVHVQGSYDSELQEVGTTNLNFDIIGKKYKPLPKDYVASDDDGNDSRNPSYFWKKIYSYDKDYIIEISKETFEEFWDMSVEQSEKINELIEKVLNKKKEK